MNATQILSELEQELVSTKSLLQIIPEKQLDFKPHEKAMSLGQLALHVATIPGRNLAFAKDGQVEAAVIVDHPIPATKEQILEGFSRSTEHIKYLLKLENTAWLSSNWKLLDSGRTLAEMPTTAFIRTFVLNHFYHHRGQLSTYLRILNQELPSIYGPSADVNPFA